MTTSNEDILKIAHLARLHFSPDDLQHFHKDFVNILKFVDQINQAETSQIEPMTNPLDMTQRMRPDEVTEIDQKELFQSIAPEVEAGLYLVRKFVED